MERADALNRVQLGVEPTGAKGVVVPANRHLKNISEAGPSLDLQIGSDDRPQGSKYAAYAVPGKEFVEADFEGQIDYGCIVYLLSSVMRRIVPPAAGVNGEVVWQFLLDRWAQEDPQTYTVEFGGGTDSERFAYGLIPDLSLEFGTEESRLSGRFLGKDFATGAVITPNPTEPEIVPVHPAHVSCHLDRVLATFNGAGPTKLSRNFSAAYEISDHWQYVWALDAANSRGPAAHVENTPDLTLELGVEANTEGMALLSDARAGGTCFIRTRAVGPLIGGAINYQLDVEGAYKISEWGDQDEVEGTTVQNATLIPTWDSGLGYAFRVTATNKIAAL